MSFSRFRVRLWGDENHDDHEAEGEVIMLDADRPVEGLEGRALFEERIPEAELRRMRGGVIGDLTSIGESTTRVHVPGSAGGFEVDLGVTLAAFGETLKVRQGIGHTRGTRIAVSLAMPRARRRGKK